MPTTVHLPADLLDQVDRRATELGMSRSRFIRDALERAVQNETEWSAPFFEHLRKVAADKEQRRAGEELMQAIRSGRRSRQRPPEL